MNNAFPRDFTIIDLETTGLSANNDYIIEIACIKVRDGKIVEEYQQLVNPGIAIPYFIQNLTGINNDMLIGKPNITQSLTGLISFIGDDILVGYNVRFDMNFLNKNFIDFCDRCIPNDYIDFLPIARKLYPNLINHKLNTVTKHLNVSSDGHHRALADCMMVYKCYMNFANQLESCIFKIRNINENTKVV